MVALLRGIPKIIDAMVDAAANIAVSKLAPGTPRQALQISESGTAPEWTSSLHLPTSVAAGVGTFGATPQYLNAAGTGGGSIDDTAIKAVVGSTASPSTTQSPAATFQKNSGYVGGGSEAGVYASLTNRVSRSGTHGTALLAHGFDYIAGSGTWIEGLKAVGEIRNGAGAGGSAQGAVIEAVAQSGTSPDFVLGVEANTYLFSGDADISVNPSASIAASYLAGNSFTGVVGASISHAGFIVNPYTPVAMRYGFLVPDSTTATTSLPVTEAAFAAGCRSKYGLDVQSGAFSVAAVAIPNNSPIQARALSGTLKDVVKVNTSDQLEIGAADITTNVMGAFSVGGLGVGAYKIAEISPLSVAAAAMEFTAIPQTFRHLVLMMEARGDTAATTANLRVQFASSGTSYDTGSNYDAQLNTGSATTVTAIEAIGTISALLGAVPAASARANLAGVMSMTMHNYRGTTFEKQGNCLISRRTGTASGSVNVGNQSFHWRSTGAVVAIKLFLSAGNFDVGSNAVLYGMP